MVRVRLVALNELNRRIGQDHPRARLTDHDCELIRQLRDQGFTYLDIAQRFEVSKATVAKICTFERRGQFAVRFKKVYMADEDEGKIEA